MLLTGVGKRYDIVSAFAQHALTVAADPNPLAPAQYAAHERRAVPRIDDPAYVPALQELCAELDVRRGRPAHRPRPRGPGAGAARARRLPAFVPEPEIARATYDKYETHLLLRSHGLPSPPTVLPGEPVDSYPVMVKPRRGSGARSIHPARDAEQADVLLPLRRRAGDGPAAHAGAGVLDRPARATSTAAASTRSRAR